MTESLIGQDVEVTSVNGIRYRGVVRTVRDAGELGELFVLGSNSDAVYQRLVYVVDRLVQVRRSPESGSSMV